MSMQPCLRYVIAALLLVGVTACSSTERHSSVFEPRPAGSTLPQTRTIEGVLNSQRGDDFEIRDAAGKEFRLHADGTTNRDSNLTTGDRVVVTMSTGSGDDTRDHMDSIRKQ